MPAPGHGRLPLGKLKVSRKAGCILTSWAQDPHFQGSQASLAAVHRKGLEDAGSDTRAQPGAGNLDLAGVHDILHRNPEGAACKRGPWILSSVGSCLNFAWEQPSTNKVTLSSRWQISSILCHSPDPYPRQASPIDHGRPPCGCTHPRRSSGPSSHHKQTTRGNQYAIAANTGYLVKNNPTMGLYQARENWANV